MILGFGVRRVTGFRALGFLGLRVGVYGLGFKVWFKVRGFGFKV
jgi:hypothetical protein